MSRKTRKSTPKTNGPSLVIEHKGGYTIGTEDSYKLRAERADGFLTALRKDALTTLRSDDAKSIGVLIQSATRELRNSPFVVGEIDVCAIRLTIAYKTNVLLAKSPSDFIVGELLEILDDCPPPGTSKKLADSVIASNKEHLATLKKEFGVSREDYIALIKKAEKFTDNQAWHIGLLISLLWITKETSVKKGWADKIVATDPEKLGKSFMSFRDAVAQAEAGKPAGKLFESVKILKL